MNKTKRGLGYSIHTRWRIRPESRRDFLHWEGNTFEFPWNGWHSVTIPTRFPSLSSVRTCLAAWMGTCSIQRPRRLSAMHNVSSETSLLAGGKPREPWACHYDGKVWKHMVLNRDVQRFPLNVPLIHGMSGKCNEGFENGGEWGVGWQTGYMLWVLWFADAITPTKTPIYRWAKIWIWRNIFPCQLAQHCEKVSCCLHWLKKIKQLSWKIL